MTTNDAESITLTGVRRKNVSGLIVLVSATGSTIGQAGVGVAWGAGDLTLLDGSSQLFRIESAQLALMGAANVMRTPMCRDGIALPMIFSPSVGPLDTDDSSSVFIDSTDAILRVPALSGLSVATGYEIAVVALIKTVGRFTNGRLAIHD